MLPIVKSIEIFKRFQALGEELYSLPQQQINKDKRYLKKHNPTAYCLLFPWLDQDENQNIQKKIFQFIYQNQQIRFNPFSNDEQFLNFLKQEKASSWGLVTAHSPFYEENSSDFSSKSHYSDQSHQASLRIRCQSLPYTQFIVEEFLGEQEFNPEAIFLLDISKEELQHLGKLFRQDATLWGTSNETEILSCAPTSSEYKLKKRPTT